jgi:Ca-activated chloride channel family protein
MHSLFPLCLTVLGVIATSAQSDCSSDAMIVFDGSGSMAEMGFNDIQEPRIFEARRAMANAIPQISQVRPLGLVIYGPNGADECSGLDLRFAPIADAAPKILADVNALEPTGSTPLTEAVKLAAETLDYQNKPATVVVVTDGKETCGGQPCALAVDLAADGMDTTVHVIGFKVRATFFSWDKEVNGSEAKVESVSRCLADSTGGTYTSAETLEQLTAALKETLGCQLLF